MENPGARTRTPSLSKMDVGGAYGAGKAGAPFDPVTFAQRPQVIVKAVSAVRIFPK